MNKRTVDPLGLAERGIFRSWIAYIHSVSMPHMMFPFFIFVGGCAVLPCLVVQTDVLPCRCRTVLKRDYNDYGQLSKHSIACCVRVLTLFFFSSPVNLPASLNLHHNSCSRNCNSSRWWFPNLNRKAGGGLALPRQRIRGLDTAIDSFAHPDSASWVGQGAFLGCCWLIGGESFSGMATLSSWFLCLIVGVRLISRCCCRG